jgi:two-component system response regulator PilR (NtrC family)
MKTVLVVDDEYLIRWALKEGLKDRYRVLTAASVDEALKSMNAEPVDAVITDLRMPIRSGMELVKILRGEQPRVKVFVISAVGSDDEFNRCYDLDVEAVLRKPLELPLIRRMVELHLNGSPSKAPRDPSAP